MTIDEIKELIQVVRDTGIAELEVQRGDNRVRIKSANATQEVTTFSGAAAGQHPAINGAATGTLENGALAPPVPARKDDERNIVVKSPIVGTYYDAPTPGSPPFVKPGDQVEAKTVLCIIESMKLMNEIEAEIRGTIVAKHLENGRPVEYGESLFTILPL
jgi:acetyl-CoA carboxylase biotin carboxyl carrier protein